MTDSCRKVSPPERNIVFVCSTLESSLEAMSEEYERCEEYWSRKLDAERAAHDAEQRAADERLAALLARAPATLAAPALPPIEERAALEAQVPRHYLRRSLAKHLNNI